MCFCSSKNCRVPFTSLKPQLAEKHLEQREAELLEDWGLLDCVVRCDQINQAITD